MPEASASQASGRRGGGGVLCTGPVLKSMAFLGVLVAIAVLSATVLQEPIADASDWLRGEGLGGYFLLAAVGYVFLVAGGSVTLFDLICGFIYGPVNGAGLEASIMWGLMWGNVKADRLCCGRRARWVCVGVQA